MNDSIKFECNGGGPETACVKDENLICNRYDGRAQGEIKGTNKAYYADTFLFMSFRLLTLS